MLGKFAQMAAKAADRLIYGPTLEQQRMARKEIYRETATYYRLPLEEFMRADRDYETVGAARTLGRVDTYASSNPFGCVIAGAVLDAHAQQTKAGYGTLRNLLCLSR